MIRREIRDLLIHNASADMSPRATTEVRSSLDKFVPNALWTFYSARGRNSALLVAFEESVRTYGLPGTAKLTDQGIAMHGLRYNSSRLWENKILNRLVRSGPMEVRVYRIPFVLGFLWAEIDGTLYQLQHQEPATSAVQVGALSETELEELRQRDRVSRSQHRSDRHATAIHHADVFEQETGQKWDAKRVVAGRRKISKVAKAEIAAVHDMYRKKSA